LDNSHSSLNDNIAITAESATQTSTAEPVLEIKNLRKSYGGVDILHDINVSIEQGDFLVLVGPSGCGKSTLLSCIGGLTEVTAGKITCKGRDLTKLDPAKRDIAMVFQSYALFPNMTVADNIGFGLEVRKVARTQRMQKISEVADILHLQELLSRFPAQLSGGQRQRVAMGRALVRNPSLFLFDEPLSNLDAKLRQTMRTEIKHLHQRLGGTMIYVTHDQVEAMTLASKIMVMKDGYIQQFGTPAEIYKRPKNTFVAQFMGSPAMNLIKARVKVVANAAHIEIQRANGDTFELIDPVPPEGINRYSGNEILIGIRPESISDIPPPPAHQSQTEGCLINYEERIGSDVYATITLSNTDVIARLHGDSCALAGQNHQLHFDLSNLSYFDANSQFRI